MEESSKKIIEEDIKKVEKEIKRNWKRIILISVVLIIAISLLLFVTGVRIRLAVHDNLIINLDPSDKSFTIDNDEEQEIKFKVSIENSIFCKANCSYALYDRSGERVIDRGSLTAKNKGHLEKTYLLTPYRRGSGQKIYNFDVQCSNIKSFLCTTKSPIRRRSSFITLNYKLTKEEEGIKNQLMPLLKEEFLFINIASKNLQRTAFILNESKGVIGINTASEGYSGLSEALNMAVEDANNANDLWSEEEYSKLNALYKQSPLKESEKLYQQSGGLLNKTISLRNQQKNLVGQYNGLRDTFLGLSKSQEQYAYYSPLKNNITERFNLIYPYLKSVNSKVAKRGYSSSALFIGDLTNISYLIKEFNKTLEDNYNLIIELGKNLSFLEYSKGCYIGYCHNISGSVCADLSRIMMEYENSTFIIGENLSVNQSYYIKEEGGIKIVVSNDSKDYYKKYCINLTNNLSYFPEDVPSLEEYEEIDTSGIKAYEIIENELTENLPQCCIYGSCAPCCTEEKCKKNPYLFPVVLIHGHSLLRKTSPEPLLDAFNKVQYQLQEDGYINAGIVRFDFNSSDYEQNDWGLSSYPIAVRASYYYDYFYSLGKYIYITKNADNIDTYTIRLNDIINLVKYRTGKPKVNLIAHSMGGLVARRYMQIFGEDSVNKLVLIATPNKGIEDDVRKFCDVFGEKRECEDMYSDSILMKKLNAPNYKPKGIKFYTISGKGCKTGREDGDGVVAFNSSALDYAKSYIVNGTCEDVFKRSLHSDILDIDKYPKVYDDIKEILKE